MPPIQTLSVILLIASMSAYLNYRYLRLPPAIGVMTVSLCLSLAMIALSEGGLVDISDVVRFVRGLNFDDLLLHGMLAFLLFAGALQVNFDELNSQKGIIVVLATVGVLIATAVTGALFWQIGRFLAIPMPFVAALTFGAIISPTDPIAVLAILKKAGVPKSIQIKISGEALFNDGIAIAVFLSLVSIAFGGELSVAHVALELLEAVAGGIAVGFVLGVITCRLLRSVDSYGVEILLTLALASGSYAVAESVHVSAPICTVVAGLVTGNHGRAFAMSQNTREHLDMFWELIDDFLNAMLFMLIGLEVITLALREKYLIAGVLAIVAMLAGRIVSVWLPVLVMKGWRTFPRGTVTILVWGGLRGGISVAMALSLPPAPQHDIIVIATFITAVFSILVQGSTAGYVARAAAA